MKRDPTVRIVRTVRTVPQQITSQHTHTNEMREDATALPHYTHQIAMTRSGVVVLSRFCHLIGVVRSGVLGRGRITSD